ncbi:MAG TPA: ABC transporter transmembrane domain-containing protein [Caulobacteraceae bacterium]|nr:ABC transporter transmembrane domain-containing protein [Caulobacteraceae bacterium]
MSEASETDGRPGAGAELAQALAEAAERRPRRRDVRPLAQLLPFVRAHWRDATAAGLFLLLAAGATLGMTAAARYVVDHGFTAGAAAALNRSFIALGAVSLVLAMASALRFYFITRLGERIVADLRQALYANIMRLDPAYFAKVRTGEVLSRMTTDVTIIESMVGSSASVALRNLLSLIGATVLLAIVSPRLTFFVMVLAPLMLAPVFLIGRQVRKLSIRAQDRFADAVGFAGENLDALETVQAFGRERSAVDRFAQAVEFAFSASVARIRARAIMTAAVIAVVFGGIAIVLWSGAQAVVTGAMSAGTLVQFVFLSVLAAGAISSLGEVWGDLQKASGAMERIAELLRARPAIAPPAQPRPLPVPSRGEVAFEGVDFAYPGRPDLPALRDFDLHVRPGERVALVGPSGAGKSTVFRLLLRFYDPQGGRVLIDGVDLREADPAEVRARLALVAQDTPLFSGSAIENIRFGREQASAEEVLSAAMAAQASSFLDELPQGFNTPLGERAKTLSGGQRQRLAIARALVRNAPILLLDEATSALDAENERLVQRALDEAMTGRTTLVIAHRLATVLKADRIVVMDAGRVVEEGSHAELSARGGLYARLAELQFGGEAA